MVDFIHFEDHNMNGFIGFDYLNKVLYSISKKGDIFEWEGLKVLELKKTKKIKKNYFPCSIKTFDNINNFGILANSSLILLVNGFGEIKNKINSKTKVNYILI